MKKIWSCSDYVFLTVVSNLDTTSYITAMRDENMSPFTPPISPSPHDGICVGFIISLWGRMKCLQFTQWFSTNSICLNRFYPSPCLFYHPPWLNDKFRFISELGVTVDKASLSICMKCFLVGPHIFATVGGMALHVVVTYFCWVTPIRRRLWSTALLKFC